MTLNASGPDDANAATRFAIGQCSLGSILVAGSERGQEWHRQTAATVDRARISTLARWQDAYEAGFRRELAGKLVAAQKPKSRTRPSFQAVFCIDVRSEILRRHLEAADPTAQTIGFAGFFGFAVTPRACGGDPGEARCPAARSRRGIHGSGSVRKAGEQSIMESIPKLRGVVFHLCGERRAALWGDACPQDFQRRKSTDDSTVRRSISGRNCKSRCHRGSRATKHGPNKELCATGIRLRSWQPQCEQSARIQPRLRRLWRPRWRCECPARCRCAERSAHSRCAGGPRGSHPGRYSISRRTPPNNDR